MMAGADGYVPATSTGLATAGGICILSEDITVYFEGEFNDARVIFLFEGASDDHAALVEIEREPLRKAKIFLRHLNP